VGKLILPQFRSHPGIQELFGRQGVAANVVDQILGTGIPSEGRAPAGSGSASRGKELQVDIASSLTIKKKINNYLKSFNKLFYRDTVQLKMEFSTTITPLSFA
jgi:hypothetical protein